MEIIENNNHVKCELGGCKNRATHAVKFAGAGLRSRIFVCEKCLNELYTAIGATVVPKSVETAKSKAAKRDKNSKADKA